MIKDECSKCICMECKEKFEIEPIKCECSDCKWCKNEDSTHTERCNRYLKLGGKYDEEV